MKRFNPPCGALLVLALALASGCTEDGASPEGVNAAVGRPGRSTTNASATPDRSGVLVANPTPKPVPARTPYIPPAYIAPSPATPDPNAPVATPGAPQPSHLPVQYLYADTLGKLTAQPFPQAPLHSLTIRDKATYQKFLQTALGTTPASLSPVNFATQDVMVIYDPGSTDQGGSCLDPTLGQLEDLGSSLVYQIDASVATANCDGSSSPAPRERSYTFLAFMRSSKPILNAPDWVP